MISAERNLLFGLVALQVGLIDQDQLVSAFRAWIGDRTRPLAEDIERWIADEPVNAHREGFWERLTRWSRTHRTLVRAAAASLVVALMAAGLIALQQHRAADRERSIANLEH